MSRRREGVNSLTERAGSRNSPRPNAWHQRSQAAQKAFVLNLGPDRAGEIPKDQLAVLMRVK